MAKVGGDTAVDLSAVNLPRQGIQLNHAVVEIDVGAHVGQLRAVVDQGADGNGSAAGRRVEETRLGRRSGFGGRHEAPEGLGFLHLVLGGNQFLKLGDVELVD